MLFGWLLFRSLRFIPQLLLALGVGFLAAGGGLYYRWNDALIVCGTLEWENVRLGLSYDLNFSSLTVASHGRGGFEVSLYYIFKKAKIRGAGREPCPFDVM